MPLIKSLSAPTLRLFDDNADDEREEEEEHEADLIRESPSLLDRLSRQLRHRLSLSPQITCRLCDQPVDQAEIDEHTLKCQLIQKLFLRRAAVDDALAEMVNGPHAALAKQAMETSQQPNGNAALTLMKIEYRVKRLEMTYYQEKEYPRLASLIERKRKICERLGKLLGDRQTWSSQSSTSSDDFDDEQPKMHLGHKLTTMIKTLLKMRGGRSSFGSSSSLNGSQSPGAIIPTISDFELLCPLSRGAYGGVYLARKRATGDRYAIKALSKEEMVRKNMVAYVMAEQRIMALLHSPCMTKLYWAFQSADWLYLVMEWVRGGDLAALIRKHTRLPVDWTRHLIAQLVLALEELHAHGLIHRDIKPENLLIAETGHLKLTDFGLSHRVGEESGDRILGTPDYLAPEVLRGEPATAASDWWSVGVCLFEMLIGGPPFMGDSPSEVFQAIRDYDGQFDWDPIINSLGEQQIPEDARKLICSLLQPDPAARERSPRSHVFFTDVDWSSLYSVASPVKVELAVPDEASPSITFTNASPSTPLRLGSSPLGRSASPFDGYQFKNVELLGEANRRLSLGFDSGMSSPSRRLARIIKPRS